MSEALMEMIEDKVGINLERKNRVLMNGEDPVNGFFNEKPLEFNCAMSKPQKEWVPIFLHEYCHYKQYKEKSKFWNDLDKIENGLWDWLNHKKELDSKELLEAITITRNLELDCEKRVVKLVEKYGLSCININEYIQLANTYILFYTLLIKTRKWYVKAPYECKEVIDTVPNKFLNSYDIVPQKYELAVMKNCF